MLRRKSDLKDRQRAQRTQLKDNQAARADEEATARAARFRTGVRGLWDWVTGKTRTIRKRNEAEAAEAAKRDARERETLVAGQLAERRVLQQEIRQVRRDAVARMEELRQDVALSGADGDSAISAE